MTRGVLAAQGTLGSTAKNSSTKDIEKVEAIKSATARAGGAAGRELAVELFGLVAGLAVRLLHTWRGGLNGGRAGIILRGGA